MFQENILVKECKKNNPIAQKELYDSYADVIMAICYRYTRNMAVAEDLLQDTLVKVLTRIHAFRWRHDGSLKAWVKTVAVNTCLTYLKKMNRNRFVDYSENESESPVEEAQEFREEAFGGDLQADRIDMELIYRAELTREEMLDALASVPEPFRIVFNMHVIDGFKHDEISRMLQINVKTSKSRLHRARKILKDFVYQMSIEKLNNLAGENRRS